MPDNDDLWDRLAADASKGSSGHWTADLGGLPISCGGAATREEALQSLRAAHRDALADASYRALAAELAALPYAVQRAARPTGSGEVMWYILAAVDAVNALAAAGRVVLGLDVREYAFDGSFREVAWNSYEPMGSGDPESARVSALDALSQEDHPGEWIVITWTHESTSA